MQQALAEGVTAGLQQINDAAAKATNSADYFGTREFLGPDSALKRAVGAALGIYGNSKEEAYYVPYQMDAHGQPLDGSKRYELRFAADQIPPAKYFWSMTILRPRPVGAGWVLAGAGDRVGVLEHRAQVVTVWDDEPWPDAPPPTSASA